MDKITIFWFRRDLRLKDNIALYFALQSEYQVLPIFIFDSEILNELPRNEARINFIFSQLQKIKKTLHFQNSNLALFQGTPLEVFEKLVARYKIQQVFCNEDYEPYAIARDRKIEGYLKDRYIGFKTYKDQVIFEKDEVVKADGNPYVVYTPFMKAWKEKFNIDKDCRNYCIQPHFQNLYRSAPDVNLTLEDLGFTKSQIQIPEMDLSEELIHNYERDRNYPSLDATSHLGPHLRFGTVSIRNIVTKASSQGNEVFLNELIWREFFMQILWHFPETATEAFKKKYDRIEWRNNEIEFENWKVGKTGYPLVDAGMRQLNASGFMHNRVRMVVASFLCKHLLIDWRWGEAYFAEKLLDYEMASNVGNWQWAAGSGVDAAPYFRIFNPEAQMEKFDNNLQYIKKWVPEFGTEKYPPPMVNHKEARERCLTAYKKALS